MKYAPGNWGVFENLQMSWSRIEYADLGEGMWVTAYGLVWARTPMRLVASVYVHDNEYVINTQGLYGLSLQQRFSLEKHLESFGLIKRQRYDGF